MPAPNPTNPKAPRGAWRRLLRVMLLACAAWLGITWFIVLLLRFVPPPTSAFMIERRVAAWHAGETHFNLRYHWVPWREISPQLPIALVASEDQKFPSHHGFDVQAIRDALDEADDGERLRGASTITQQTAKNLFLWNGRSFVRKGLEAYFTVLLEVTWPKRRILEVYANIAEFGDGVYGAQAAAQAFFHEPAARLDGYQSALLASVLPSPRKLHADRPSRYVLGHAQWTQRQVRQLGGVGYLPR